MSFPGGSVVKTMPAITGDAGDDGSIPRSGIYPGAGNSNTLQIVTWKIPWTEEPGRLESKGLQRVRCN